MKLGICSIVVIGMLSVGGASAHHSYAQDYLLDQNVTMDGIVVQFAFRNPHSLLTLDIVGQDGRTGSRWVVEWDNTAALRQSGVDQSTFKAGDKVTVAGAPDRNPENRKLLMRSVIRPSDGWSWAGRVGQDDIAIVPASGR